MKKAAVLMSGNGRHFRNLLRNHVPIEVAVFDRLCPAFTFAQTTQVPVELVEWEDLSPSFDTEAYTRRVLDVLLRYGISIVILDGWRTILGSEICYVYGDDILNVHPSLLPKHKGLHAVRDALAESKMPFGRKYTGCTVHRVAERMDEGEIIGQAIVHIEPDDTEASLRQRIQDQEFDFYLDIILQEMR